MGKAEQEVLPRGAPRRQRLLLEALECLVRERDWESVGFGVLQGFGNPAGFGVLQGLGCWRVFRMLQSFGDSGGVGMPQGLGDPVGFFGLLQGFWDAAMFLGCCRVFGMLQGLGVPAGFLASRAAPSQLLPLPLFQKVPGTQLKEEDAEVLGWLVCELGGQHIRSSGGSLLKALSRCGSFLPEQGEAIRDVLSSGNTTFGYGVYSWTAPSIKPLPLLNPE